MNNLCIIPARGGSKRIPRKNIKDFLGKPIISYSIKAAKESALFNEVMVSTDDDEIARISLENNATVPFLRSDENANEFATLADVLIEVVSQYSINGKSFDNICCILPTAPMIKSQRIIEAYNLMLTGNFDSVCPVVEFSYPILRGLELSDNNILQMVWPEHLKSRSQDLKPIYHDSGSFYWIKTNSLLKEETLLCKNGGAIILSEIEVQDIDSETDWELAELKYKLSHNQI